MTKLYLDCDGVILDTINMSYKMLKEKGRVGVINACVRLKMYTGDHVKFHIESERGVGTEVSVVIPLNAIS